jgi:hypothetical protein
MLMLAGGLLVAGGANAAVLQTVTNTAAGGCSVTSLSGNVGDTFTFINNLNNGLGTGGGSGAISPSTIPASATTNPVTLITPGTVDVYCGFSTPGDILTITIAAAPAPAAVPTLSEWAQLMLALMVIGIAWHFHNNRQNSY